MTKYLKNEIKKLLFSFCKTPRKARGVCKAKTRRGTLCQAPPVWSKAFDRARNGRCKLHGGLSTGPKTEAGKEAIRMSNKVRKRGYSSQ
ncbi:MAG TPA: HGGxSTG domain-containing protein [Gammaproteobacteria bacterium]|nr:HGGxSTG domain-containing protein [Gammaproteobacteria bacterium]